MSTSSQNKQKLTLMNKESKGSSEEGEENDGAEFRKESIDDLLSGTHEIIGSGIGQAISLSSSAIFQTSTAPFRCTPSPTNSLKGSSKQKRDQQISETDLQTLFLNTTDRIDNAEDSISKSSDSSQQISSDGSKPALLEGERPKSSSKLSERAKKKSWYNVLYPSYKSRSEDFKKLFKDVPDDERLVVDYSCAFQRDILVHGRLYVSQNYLCFYANIFRWETCLNIKWKDVTSISKEKTALVIPNAILVCTENDKFFFTSFTTRDKAFLMLFRVWQNALMNKSMQPQEMWQWVHNCYGHELGLTSDDEDYVDPFLSKEDEQIMFELPYIITKNKSTESFLEDQCVNEIQFDKIDLSSKSNKTSETPSSKDEGKILKVCEAKRRISKSNRQRDDCHSKNSEMLPTDLSDSSDSDENKNIPFISTADCSSNHEGRQLVHTILPINVDTLFNLLFSKSKFLMEFHASRKSSNFDVQKDWNINEDNINSRIVSVTVALSQSVGPKSAHVTEHQVMRDCSKVGQLYSIDISSVNAGIPYADSFCVVMHYCLVKTVDDHTMLSVHAQIKYKKSIWGVVKGFIEKNTWAGLEDFYNALLRALQSEYCIPPAKSKGRRPRKGALRPLDEVIASNQNDIVKKSLPSPMRILSKPASKFKMISFSTFIFLILLILFNVILLFKLWSLEKTLKNEQLPNFSEFKDLPKNNKDWISLLKQQEFLYENEMRKWQTVLQTAIELLKNVSVVCETIVNRGKIKESLNKIKEDL